MISFAWQHCSPSRLAVLHLELELKKLNKFVIVDPPLPAAEIKRISGINHVFMSTMFGVDAESGKKVRQYIFDRKPG